MAKSPGSIAGFTRRLIASARGAAKVPCGTCHACCSDPNLRVDLTPEEAARFPEAVPFPESSTTNDMQLPRKPNGDCVHLQSGRCGIYDRRPASCRGYDCRLYLLGFPVHVDQVNLLEQVDAMWGDWRLETPEDVDAMFAWQRAFSETMQVAAARRLDKQEMEASILTLLLRYLGSAHEVREQIGLPQARKLAQHQSDVIRDGVLRSVIASVRDAPAQAAE